MGTQDEGLQWKEEYEKCAEKLKQLEILSKDGESMFCRVVKSLNQK